MIDIIIFARSPVRGAVKQRLAATVGERAALAVHRKLLRHTLRTAVRARGLRPDLRPVLWHLGPRPDRDLPAGFPGRTEAQPFADMASNLAASVARPALEGRRGVIVVGSDHPGLTADHLLAMAGILDRVPVAVGPAEDGGFWAVGTLVPLDHVMCKVPLGAADTRLHLTNVLERLGLAYGLGPTLWDVDTAADLERWGKELRLPRE
ncbi:MAG: DUF2064 domain-containing protein [Deltaproteobacteria bacterium]|nr:DUF2064 domain-containing protein [Deltaproteobacteria bacterium]